MKTLDPKTSAESKTSLLRPEVADAIQAAVHRIPPLWPLKHFVAVNPFLGFSHLPFEQACATLASISGQAPLPAAADFLAAWKRGEITRSHLDAVVKREVGTSGAWTSERLLAWVEAREKAEAVNLSAPGVVTVADWFDRGHAHAHWGEFITGEISKFCSVHFDENQTIWTSPWKTAGLYASWLEYTRVNRNPEVFGLRGFRSFTGSLPSQAQESIAWCLEKLPVSSEKLTDFLHRQLFTVLGWAGYLQYLVREDSMRGRSNGSLVDLLAIRLAYDAALHEAYAAEFAGPMPGSSVQGDSERVAEDIQAGCIWQQAYELGLQENLVQQLTQIKGGNLPPVDVAAVRPSVQAIFCIDVRSEILRRHLEAAEPTLRTIGFAGFFGIPVAHRLAGEELPATRCPVLLVPPISTVEAVSTEQTATVFMQREFQRAWKGFQNSAASCFTFVETLGLGFAAKLGLKGAHSCGCAHAHSPALDPATPDPVSTRAALALGALKNMGLTSNFARLVLICGHGSESANNPYASALDCGACGGHAGDVNARLAADILNDPLVREALQKNGIHLPEDTWFLAGLHNTTTDEVQLLDGEKIPNSHLADAKALRRALGQAGENTRRERALGLGLERELKMQFQAQLPTAPPQVLGDIFARRARDISQVRPEWGLANNAAFIAAPRARTAGLPLGGRVFLHDYEASKDADLSVLTLILTAPVVVASWINLQYYGSRVNPEVYGSGNKTLHNIAGGLGVYEGNGGDLRPGLPLQSIHNGENFVHEPRRLSVFVEAAPANISSILDAYPEVRQLFRHGWLHLLSLQGTQCLRYQSDGQWVVF